MTNKIGPYTLGPSDTTENGIYTGDARKLSEAIPDGSIDLIFTDPVYQRIEDYEWLAKTAIRVLRPDRACLTFCSIQLIPETLRAIERGGLQYRWMMPNVCAMNAGRGDYGLYSKWACLLWLDKGRSKPRGWRFDVFFGSSGQSKISDPYCHRWQKQPQAIAYYMGILGGIVFDPFTGGGSVPAVCKYLTRSYLAFEIDAETAKAARERVKMTQPPLFSLEPEQLKFP